MRTIVFVLRGCPVAALGPYGNEWIATPHLDGLAAESIVFDRHCAEDPLQTERSWRWGRSDSTAALIRANRTANDAPPEFYAGWDQVFDARPHEDDHSRLDRLLQVLPVVLDELNTTTDWQLWIDIDALLPPWQVPQGVFDVYLEDLTDAEELDPDAESVPPWRDPPVGWFDGKDQDAWELLHRSFAAAMTTFDADFGLVLKLLRDRGGDQPATWVVTADAGQPLGEHGFSGIHRPWLHEEWVHLPLIVRLPAMAGAGVRYADLTCASDLPAMLAAGSWKPLPRGTVVSRAVVGDSSEWSIRTAEWTLLVPDVQHPEDADDPRPMQLFRYPEDRFEACDRLAAYPEVVEELLLRVSAVSITSP